MTNLHFTAEDLSAYLDEALPPATAERVERHLADCDSCRRHLGGLRNAVHGLRRLERQAPPATLGQMVARRVAFERTRPSLADRLEQGFESLDRQSSLLALFALVIALAVIMLLFAQALEQHRNAVSPVIFQDPPAAAPNDTPSRDLAGRLLVLTDDGWIEAGIDPDAPFRRVGLESVAGRALLEAYPELAGLRGLKAPARLDLEGEIIEISPPGALPPQPSLPEGEGDNVLPSSSPSGRGPG